MSKKQDSELGDDFSYIIRIADSDVDGLIPLFKQLKDAVPAQRMALVAEMFKPEDPQPEPKEEPEPPPDDWSGEPEREPGQEG